jgi:hypothetical protein
MYVQSSTFRLGAVLLGVAGIALTAISYQWFWLSIGIGILFGAAGWLIDYFTGFRALGGFLASWALAAGGAIVGFAWQQQYRFEDATTQSVWPGEIQYASVVLLCWGILMYVAPKPFVSPNKSLERTREG